MSNKGSERALRHAGLAGGHNLPQMLTMSSNPRLAVSKSSKEETEDNMPNIITNIEPKLSKEESKSNNEKENPQSVTAINNNKGTDKIPVEQAFTPKLPASGSEPVSSHSPTTPVKLRIRNALRQQTETDNIYESKTPEPMLVTPVSSKSEVRKRGECMSDPGPLRKNKKKRGRPPHTAKMKKTSLPGVDKTSVVQAQTVPESTGYPSNQTPKWLVGDMVWSKVSGHPWWPCMVSYDPLLGIYTRFKGPLYKPRPTREYHVQFFGDVPERGWISETSTLAFEGKEAFHNYASQLREQAQTKIQRKNIVDKFKLDMKGSGRKKLAWDIAYQSAMLALPLSLPERKRQYTFVYEPPKSKKTTSTIPDDSSNMSDSDSQKSSSQLNGHLTTNAARKRKLREALAAHTPDSNKPLKKRRTRTMSRSPPAVKSLVEKLPLSNQSTTQFLVFCQKRHEAVRKDHPDYNDERVYQCLKEQWNLMDEEQKCRFIPMGCDVTQLCDLFPGCADLPSVSHKRISKPTKKILESANDIELSEEEENFDCKEDKRKTTEEASVAEKGPSTSVDETIQLVAGGEGEVLMPSSSDGNDLNIAEPVKKQTKKLKSIASSSELIPGTNILEPPKKRFKKTGFETPDGSEFDDAASRISIDSKDSVAEQKESAKKTITLEDGNEYELEIFRLNSTSSQKKEHICQLCENPGDVLVCEGQCGGSFHLNCIGLTQTPSEPFKCDECTTGIHTCFCCKKASSDTKKCSVGTCCRFYHEDCVKKLHLTKFESKGFHCPLHYCATCAAEDPKNLKVGKGRFYRCVRCPTAYHYGDYCIAAGSVNLAGQNMVCTNHFHPLQKVKHHSKVNVSYCFLCSRGGTLLCCETCPASFHAECLNIDFPEGAWHCADCSRGKRPLYGDIIWVKLGNYRWWPGEINHPRNVPLNIQGMHHQVGEFPVRFFGSHDFYWIHRARVFLFQEGDKGSKESATAKGLAKVFSRGVREATMAFKLWQAAKLSKEQQENEKNDRKPPPYRHVKSNFPIGGVQIFRPDPSTLPCCECNPDLPSPCGVDSECINRLMLYECHPASCPAGEKCENQRFQKRQYPSTKSIKITDKGWGLVSLENINKGEFVMEYVGDLIDEEECRRRIKKAHEENVTNFYMLTLDKDRIIDAGPKGNLSRFMNHSCQPNLITQKWTVNGDIRVGLFATEDISANAELTFNYNLDALGNEKTKCQCGAPLCSGYLGVRPKTDVAEKKVKKKKRKPKLDPRREHEDDCYRCGEGGELVMCDRGKCPKAYHLQCLNLTKPPHGKWDCPWHHCDICGKASVHLCTECPNSYCSSHIEGNIVDLGHGKKFCLENHEDLIEVFKNSGIEPGSSCESETASTESSEESEASSVSEIMDKVQEIPKKQPDSSKNGKTVAAKDRPLTHMEGKSNSSEQKLKSNNAGKAEKKSSTSQQVAPQTEAMFDDNDSEFGDLVIDIPNV